MIIEKSWFTSKFYSSSPQEKKKLLREMIDMWANSVRSRKESLAALREMILQYNVLDLSVSYSKLLEWEKHDMYIMEEEQQELDYFRSELLKVYREEINASNRNISIN